MAKVKALTKSKPDTLPQETGPATAKLFQNGRSQAVRLPKEYRFEGEEIGVGRVGKAVILYPLNDPWSVFFEGAEELSKSDIGTLERDQHQPKRRF